MSGAPADAFRKTSISKNSSTAGGRRRTNSYRSFKVSPKTVQDLPLEQLERNSQVQYAIVAVAAGVQQVVAGHVFADGDLLAFHRKRRGRKLLMIGVGDAKYFLVSPRHYGMFEE